MNGTDVRLLAGGKVWRLKAADGDASDVVEWLINERSDQVEGALVALSRQQVVTQLGRGIPSDFPGPDVVIGDPDQGGIRGWWDSTVQAYLRDRAGEGEAVSESVAVQGRWVRKSRQWEDVEFSGADHRVLIVTSLGIVTPAGVVVSRPLEEPDHLTDLVIKYPWQSRKDSQNPQVWVSGEALEALSFPSGSVTAKTLKDVVADFFGVTVGYEKSGFFGCTFSSPEPDRWPNRTVDVVLMPATHLDPSGSRPADRGVIGIVDTSTILPEEEAEAAHLLADRIAWLYGMEGVLPAPRWALVGGTILAAAMSKARPSPSNAAAKRVPCPLPARVGGRGVLPSQWWTSKNWRRKHRKTTAGVDVELDQQAAYLPSAAELYCGWGTPEWVTPDPRVFDQQRPPQGLFHLTVPAGNDCDGLYPQLPVPHPGMSWSKPETFWATTVDIQQLIAPVDNGGAGLAIAELDIDAAWVWPEQHQWLKGFAVLLRKRLQEARSSGRLDYEQMIKALYTSVFGRLSAVGAGAWKYPLLDLQQPVWYASIEGFSRWRAMKYACRIARDFDLYPSDCLADAWFYRIPENVDPAALEDPLRPDGTRSNGSYRLKALPGAA
ncbi:hypothetical protein C0J29_32240 (plasmid) [Mycobacterium paragordonae]|uniref:Uncharacterized protein n=1 Tax=Mycobacterium paragordonae TaxID=1389713 RepID=A0ABQ1CFM9_9MYCO|nr:MULTISPECIES: hypothetical protein [Mycobacterium]AYE99626.1 hypothetical protein C0J29_32240 [Mycobacterium paragordonae]QNI15289.1 hypothetical protein GAN18_29385 [Mycobacterium kubicae]GFG83137.1 hypothetical protein MPRG_64130 [Mycobacterium paragordonae]